MNLEEVRKSIKDQVGYINNSMKSKVDHFQFDKFVKDEIEKSAARMFNLIEKHKTSQEEQNTKFRESFEKVDDTFTKYSTSLNQY